MESNYTKINDLNILGFACPRLIAGILSPNFANQANTDKKICEKKDFHLGGKPYTCIYKIIFLLVRQINCLKIGYYSRSGKITLRLMIFIYKIDFNVLFVYRNELIMQRHA